MSKTEFFAVRSAPFIPPHPIPPSRKMSTLQRMRSIRKSGLVRWGQRAYQVDMLQGRFLGRNTFTLNTPEAIRHVLSDNHENYVRTPPLIRVLQPVLGEGLLLAEGSSWRHQRRTLAPAFTPRAVATLVPHVRAVITRTVEDIGNLGNAPVNLRDVVQRMALEIASRTMFSFGMAEHGQALRSFVLEYSVKLNRPHFWDMLLPLSLPSPQDIQRQFFRRRWTHFIRKLVVERQTTAQSTQASSDLFDMLVAGRDPETGQAFSDDHLVDQVATMILAGHETTAAALFWSLYLLAQTPSYQDEIARESNCARSTGSADLEGFRFTRAVLNEALRLYPPVYLIARCAAGADRILDKPVEKGDLVFISPWLLHRHEKHWTHPNAFVPERFLSGPPDRFSYLPFGFGPRTCIGGHFALVEATLAIAEIVRSFRITLLDSRPVMPICAVTTQPDYSPMFKLVPRQIET